MSIQVAKVVGTGLIGASGSSAAVYGTYYLTTKETEQETNPTTTSHQETPTKPTLGDSEAGSQATSNKHEELKSWMNTNKCFISVKINGATAIDLKTAENQNQTLISNLLTKLNSNKTEFGCPSDSNSKAISVVLKTSNSEDFELDSYESLKDWMNSAKCQIETINVETTPSEGQKTKSTITVNGEDSNKDMIKKLFKWVVTPNNDKSTLGCDSNTTTQQITIKTTDNGISFSK